MIRRNEGLSHANVDDAQGLPCAIRSDRGSGQDAIPDTSAHAAAWLRLCPSQRRPRHTGATGLAHKNIQHTVRYTELSPHRFHLENLGLDRLSKNASYELRNCGGCRRFVQGMTEIAPELTGHGLPLSKCEAYNRVYDPILPIALRSSRRFSVVDAGRPLRRFAWSKRPSSRV